MINIRDGKYILYWDERCYCVAEVTIAQSGAKEGGEVLVDRSYHSTLTHAINELILHRKLPEKNVTSFKELFQAIKDLKNEIDLMFGIQSDEVVEILTRE